MRRRLRKKLHLAEFRALGFRVEALSNEQALSMGSEECDWWSSMIELVESRGLRCGGGGDATSVAFFFERTPRSCDDADRAALAAWFRARREFSMVNVSELVDVHYPDGPRRRR